MLPERKEITKIVYGMHKHEHALHKHGHPNLEMMTRRICVGPFPNVVEGQVNKSLLENSQNVIYPGRNFNFLLSPSFSTTPIKLLLSGLKDSQQNHKNKKEVWENSKEENTDKPERRIGSRSIDTKGI